MRKSSRRPNTVLARRAYSAVGAGTLVALVMFVAYATRFVDSPTGIVTWSGAFVTDEGFHSKWAQNAVRFASYGDPYDFSFAPAGLLHNVAVLLVFHTFGASFEVLRLYAGFLAALGLLLYWTLLRSAPPGFPRWQAMAFLVVTVNYPAYMRVLFIDPLGIVFSLLALSLAVRRQGGWPACALSIVFAFCAFLTKIHYLDVLFIVGIVWLFRVTLWRDSSAAVAHRERIALVCTTSLMLLVAGMLLWLVRDSIGEFVSTTRTQFFGRSDASYSLKLVSSELQVLGNLPQNTHHAAFFAALLVAAALLVGGRRWRSLTHGTIPQDRAGWIVAKLSSLRDFKLDVAMGLWLVLGLLLRGASSYQPPRYFYALLFPLSYFAVRLLQQALKRYRYVAFLAVLLLHYYVKSPLYYTWLVRKDCGSLYL